MSLISMKRKALEKQNISRTGFSLNGGIRNLPYVGKSSLQHRTFCQTNDSSVIKTSAANNKGLLHKYNKIPVAKDVNGNNSSSERTQELREDRELCEKKQENGC